jgi:hypothetical protein
MLLDAGFEVGVGLRPICLHQRSDRFAGEDHQPHELQRREPAVARLLAEVRRQQQLERGRVEVVVNGEAGEIEQRIAHRRVLPADQRDRGPRRAIAEHCAREEVGVGRGRVAQR